MFKSQSLFWPLFAISYTLSHLKFMYQYVQAIALFGLNGIVPFSPLAPLKGMPPGLALLNI